MSKRVLLPPPASFLDARGFPRTGSFAGALPRANIGALSPSPLFRVAHHKRWFYMCIVSEEILIAAAVVHLGYLSNAFVYALHAPDRKMLFKKSMVAPSLCARIGETADEIVLASFRMPGVAIQMERRTNKSELVMDIRWKGFELAAHASPGKAPPISAVVNFGDGLMNRTEKRAPLEVSGEAIIEGTKYSMNKALAGYDHTNGLLPRHTVWKWAFALGHAKSGERVAFNLVEGFMGEAECALWVDDELFPLSEGRIELDRKRPLDAWRVRTAEGELDLRFDPYAMHSDARDLGIVASNFVQPAGSYSGRIQRDGKNDLELDSVLGVAEDQDMKW